MSEITLSEQEVIQRTAEAVSGAGAPRPFGKYVVEGTKLWASHVVAVKSLVFKPGAKLIFDAAVVRRSANVFIFTEEIVSQDQENMGEIGWTDSPASEPPAAGDGPAGASYAHVEGATGGAGGTGGVGQPGENGYSAPNLTIVTNAIASGLKISLAGENGGPGGRGGRGGTGGQGGKGNPASQSLFDCKRGAGDGHPGGAGGAGGPGGRGGDGGNGGTFTLVTNKDNVAALTRLLRVDLNGGQPGAGGLGGQAGTGGPGGPGGQEARPYCSGNGSTGPSGPAGTAGSAGPSGSAGNSGTLYVGGLEVSDLEDVLYINNQRQSLLSLA